VLQLTGHEVPAELSIDLQIEPDPVRQRAIGVSYAARLAAEVVAGGAPGVHLYAFNNHETVLAVLGEAGIQTPIQKETVR